MAEQTNGKAKAQISKMEAVTQTLQEFGRDIMPLAIKDHLKKRYGIEISADVASNYKKKLVKKANLAAQVQATKPADTAPVLTPPVKTETSPPAASRAAKKPAPPAKKAAAPKQQPPAPQVPEQASATSGGNILLDDVLTAKELLDRVGVDNLRTLIDGLAK